MEKLEKYIDHTNLKAFAVKADIEKLCAEAEENNFASVCVNPYWVPFCAERLSKTDVNVCTVIGFPLGATSTESKAFETKTAVEQGADEVDMVINVGLAKDGEWDALTKDIEAVVLAAKDTCKDTVVKVILETCYLTDEQIVKACECCKKAQADFVKTSTGFGTDGATVHHVEIMKKTVKDELKVKAAGGIRDKETALAMIKAGASRLGTSSGKSIIT
ncbi:MAG: deoxyribose-phosphate aldolase [Treponemataceae bacterium]|nr:deoxyribose-phosphate aldolase [Treponemataceae bacterium]